MIRARADNKGGGKPVPVQDINLLLPSSVTTTVHCDPYLLQYEWKLRYSHAEGALNELRGLLLMRSLLWKSKGRYSRGQRQQTRSRTLISRVEGKIQFVASKYRCIRQALVKLSDRLLESDWENTLRELHDSDISGLTSTDDTGSEGRKKLTWIWKVKGVDLNSDKSTQAGMYVIVNTKQNDTETFFSPQDRMVPCPGARTQVAGRMSASSSRNGTDTQIFQMEGRHLAQTC